MSGSLQKSREAEELEDLYDDVRCRCDVTYHSREENTWRGNWPYGLQGTLALLGAVLGTPWFFMIPHSIFQHGAAFLIPYTLFLVLLTVPVFYLLATVGQFSSSGVLTCWMIPIFKAVGLVIFVWTLPATIVQSTYTSTDLYYLHESITSSLHNTSLPWHSFDTFNTTATGCLEMKEEDTAPEELYYECYVRSALKSDSDPHGARVNTPMVLSLLIVWILTCMLSCCGIPSIAWASTLLVPAVLIMIIVLAALADKLPASESIWTKGGVLPSSQGYFAIDALKCALATVLETIGIIITFSSYNRFHNDIMRDVTVVLVLKYAVDVLVTTFLGGLINHGTNEMVTQFHGRAAGYFSGLVGGLGPYAIAFLMLTFFVRLLNLVAHLETVVTGLGDQFSGMRRYRPVVVLLACIGLFLLSIPMATTSGPYLAVVLEEMVAWIPILILLLTFACFLLYAILTYFRHRHDVAAMTRWNLYCVPSLWVWFVCSILALIIVPLCLLGVFSDWLYHDYTARSFDSWLVTKPSWASHHLVSCARALPVVVIVVTLLVQIVRSLVLKKPDWKTLLGIIPSWNPALTKHWTRVRRYRQLNPYSTSNYDGWRDRTRDTATLVVEGRKQTVTPFYI